jgi:hypothetical protein
VRGAGREEVGRPEIGAEADEGGGLAPARVVDGGVDDQFDDHVGCTRV